MRGDASLRVLQRRAVAQPNKGQKLIELAVAVDRQRSPRKLRQRRLVLGDDGSKNNAHWDILTASIESSDFCTGAPSATGLRAQTLGTRARWRFAVGCMPERRPTTSRGRRGSRRSRIGDVRDGWSPLESRANPAPSDAFPCCAARRVARMVHFSNLVSPSCLTHRRAKCAWKRHSVAFPAEGISRRGVADGRRVRASLRARGSHAFRCVSGCAMIRVARMVHCSKPVLPSRLRTLTRKVRCQRQRGCFPQRGGVGRERRCSKQ